MSDFDSAEHAPEGNAAAQIINGDYPLLALSLAGTHPVIQDTKAEFKGLANAGPDNSDEQPHTYYHSLFSEIFTWKYPKATSLVFVSIISLIFAFRFVNVLRYVFKGAYMLFFSVTALEIASKPLSREGLVSSLRPKRYYTLPRDSTERFFGAIHELANFFILEFQRVMFVENIFTTIAAFVASFFGYFLIKYIPLWGLSLLATVTAFTAPLIYLNNQELIDEQIRKANEFANAQLENGRKLSEKYADTAIIKARETVAELTHKVQEMTGGAKKRTEAVANKAGSNMNMNGVSDETSAKPAEVLKPTDIEENTPVHHDSDFPSVPTSEPAPESSYSHEEVKGNDPQEPLLA